MRILRHTQRQHGQLQGLLPNPPPLPGGKVEEPAGIILLVHTAQLCH